MVYCIYGSRGEESEAAPRSRTSRVIITLSPAACRQTSYLRSPRGRVSRREDAWINETCRIFWRIWKQHWDSAAFKKIKKYKTTNKDLIKETEDQFADCVWWTWPIINWCFRSLMLKFCRVPRVNGKHCIHGFWKLTYPSVLFQLSKKKSLLYSFFTSFTLVLQQQGV